MLKCDFKLILSEIGLSKREEEKLTLEKREMAFQRTRKFNVGGIKPETVKKEGENKL